jgi:hypothetical protein
MPTAHCRKLRVKMIALMMRLILPLRMNTRQEMMPLPSRQFRKL